MNFLLDDDRKRTGCSLCGIGSHAVLVEDGDIKLAVTGLYGQYLLRFRQNGTLSRIQLDRTIAPKLGIAVNQADRKIAIHRLPAQES